MDRRSSSAFVLVAPSESTASYATNGECRICVPSLNMCFTTNKLQPLNLTGNIFEGTKLARPLTIQDYIHILIDNDKHIDSELAAIISNIQSLTARYRRSNETDKSQSNPSGRHLAVGLFVCCWQHMFALRRYADGRTAVSSRIVTIAIDRIVLAS